MENYRNAAGCIVFNEDKLLLLRRSKLETSQHGLYELPGGKQEENMSLMDTARIETEEESGLVVKVIQALKPHIDHEMKKVYHGYLAIIEGDDTIKLFSPILRISESKYMRIFSISLTWSFSNSCPLSLSISAITEYSRNISLYSRGSLRKYGLRSPLALHRSLMAKGSATSVKYLALMVAKV